MYENTMLRKNIKFKDQTCPEMSVTNKTVPSIHVGIVGGGVAGATTALFLAQAGAQITLFEEGSSLVNGPPMCHLHAGGNFYRDISDDDCIKLLKRSIELLEVYPYALNKRPTVFAVPKRDSGSPEDLLPRLEKVREAYAELIHKDSSKALLGPAEDYFKSYSRDQVAALSLRDYPKENLTTDDWLVPVAKNINLDEFQFPLIVVQEYGLSLFRLAASASLSLEAHKNVQVYNNCKVDDIREQGNAWNIISNGTQTQVDFIVNSSGYRSGVIDDLLEVKRERLLEFKAAYLAKWPEIQGDWPELVIHGQRNTADGMIQLSPYSNGLFQIHGMTDKVTLFKDGLASSTESSAQPNLNKTFQERLTSGWNEKDLVERTQAAIDHASVLVPSFASAKTAGKPLFGAQQIPGKDAKLRTADVSFSGDNYARTEIIKASSAPAAARAIVKQLQDTGRLTVNNQLAVSTEKLSFKEIHKLANQLAKERGFPQELV